MSNQYHFSFNLTPYNISHYSNSFGFFCFCFCFFPENETKKVIPPVCVSVGPKSRHSQKLLATSTLPPSKTHHYHCHCHFHCHPEFSLSVCLCPPFALRLKKQELSTTILVEASSVSGVKLCGSGEGRRRFGFSNCF